MRKFLVFQYLLDISQESQIPVILRIRSSTLIILFFSFAKNEIEVANLFTLNTQKVLLRRVTCYINTYFISIISFYNIKLQKVLAQMLVIYLFKKNILFLLLFKKRLK